MYLVEYTKICRNELKKCCTCFYTIDEAVDFGNKLIDCSNIKSVRVSDVNINVSEVIYEMEVNQYAK